MNDWYLRLDRWSRLTSDQIKQSTKHGMKGVVIKAVTGTEAASPTLEKDIDIAREHNVPFALLHALDPTERTPIPQLSEFSGLVNEVQPSFVVLSMDIWWRRWSEYNSAYVTHTGRHVPRLTSDVLNNWLRDYIINLRKRIKVPYYVQAASWYIHDYSRAVAGTIRSLANGYIGVDPVFHSHPGEISMTWKSFKKALEEYVPNRYVFPPAAKPRAFELGYMPVEDFPLCQIGYSLIDDLFGSQEIPKPEEEFPEGS